jgi:hypothetical protein
MPSASFTDAPPNLKMRMFEKLLVKNESQNNAKTMVWPNAQQAGSVPADRFFVPLHPSGSEAWA